MPFELTTDLFRLQEQYVGQCDSVLRSIVRLSQASVIFNIFDSLFVRWMELLVTLNLHDKVSYKRKEAKLLLTPLIIADDIVVTFISS